MTATAALVAAAALLIHPQTVEALEPQIARQVPSAVPTSASTEQPPSSPAPPNPDGTNSTDEPNTTGSSGDPGGSTSEPSGVTTSNESETTTESTAKPTATAKPRTTARPTTTIAKTTTTNPPSTTTTTVGTTQRATTTQQNLPIDKPGSSSPITAAPTSTASTTQTTDRGEATSSAIPFGPATVLETQPVESGVSARGAPSDDVRQPGTAVQNPADDDQSSSPLAGPVGPVGKPAEPFEPGDSARRAGSGHATARQPDPLPSLATIELAGHAVRAGTRDSVALTAPCNGANTGRLENYDTPIADLDRDPDTFTIDLDGVDVGTRVLALDCANATTDELELLVYSQTSSPAVGPGALAILTTVALGAVGAALGAPGMVGTATSRRRRDGWPPHWFPPDP